MRFICLMQTQYRVRFYQIIPLCSGLYVKGLIHHTRLFSVCWCRGEAAEQRKTRLKELALQVPLFVVLSLTFLTQRMGMVIFTESSPVVLNSLWLMLPNSNLQPQSLLSSRFIYTTARWTSALGRPIINVPQMKHSISCPSKPALLLVCLLFIIKSVFIHLLRPKTQDS